MANAVGGQVSELQTRASLLSQLGKDPYDNSAWSEFEARYGPRIEAWCRRWGLQDADAKDVVQTVLVRLAVKMRGFRYDPGRSFRAWLKTLTHHAWSDYVSDRQRMVSIEANTGAQEALMSLAAADDLQQRVAEAFDLELLDLATRQVRKRVAEHTWEAFRLTALDGKPAVEAAAVLGISVVQVFKARSNVQKMLRETIAGLESEQPSTP